MRHTQIAVGDALKLKRDNAYGLGPLTVNVVGIEPRPGYTVPWIRGSYHWTNPRNGDVNLDFGHFKPSDFAGRAS